MMLEPSNMGLEENDDQPVDEMGLALSDNYRFTARFRGQSSSPTKISGKMCVINFHQ